MDSIQRLPNELLLRIFSRMDTSDLLNLDTVCQRWNSLIKEFVWNRVTCIDEEMIDYPYGNFVERFIAICHRVDNVHNLFTGVSPEFTRGKGNPKCKEAMKNALIVALKKLAPGSALPLHLLEDVLVLNYPMEREKINANQLPPVSEVRSQVSALMREIRAGEFDAIQVKQLSLTKPELALDPFSVKFNGRPHPMVPDLSHITRLNIQSLVALTTSEDKGGLTASQNILSWVMCFPRLQSIRLEQLDFVKPATVKSSIPVLAVKIKFHSDRCQLSIDEFLSFLRALGEGKEKTVRTKKIATLIDAWKRNDWIERCEFAVHTVESSSFMYDVKYGRDHESFGCDATSSIVSRLFLSPLTSKLHIHFYQENDDEAGNEEDLMKHVHNHKILAQLKHFSASFSLESCRKRNSRCDGEWDPSLAADIVIMVLRYLKASMKNVETLHLDFTSRVDYSCSDLLKPVHVSGPLPRLRELCFRGLPSFPFIVSLVQQAPNLRCLVIASLPVQDERANVEWIKRLLTALEHSKHLSILVLNVEQRVQSFHASDFKLRNRLSDDNASDRDLKAAIGKHTHRVISLLPQLHRVSIDIGLCHFQLDLNRYGATDRLFLRE